MLVWPVRGLQTREPVSTSETRIVLSDAPVMIHLESGDQLTILTHPLWPVKTWNLRFPVTTSHIAAVVSALPAACGRPLGLYYRPETSTPPPLDQQDLPPHI